MRSTIMTRFGHSSPEAAHGMPSCDVSLPKPSSSIPETSCSGAKKRKAYSYAPSSTCDEDCSEDARSSHKGSVSEKKQNHSEIEKRRRDKMNTYIAELSNIVPMCGAMARKLDKLTVLRLAVQHLRSIRGALLAGPLTAQPRPAFLSERELNALVVQAASDCFVMVVGCDRGKLMYVSESVKKMLHFDQSELFGQSFFDILHPKDIAKVKEQLSSSDLNPRERFIDAKTMLPVKADVVAGATRLTPGARRSFVCRIKCRLSLDGNQSNQTEINIKEEKVQNAKMKKKLAHEKKYCVVQCTGYLKSWAPLEVSGTSSPADSGVEDNEACNMSCLVAVGRALSDMTSLPQTQNSTFMRQLEFGSRHATDGKFLFVDQRVTVILGFLPQEILGTSMYEYVSQSDLGVVAKAHKTALLQREALKTPPYFFRRKDGAYACIQTHFKPFRNPWTKDLECIVAKNTLITDDIVQNPTEHCQSYDIYKMNGAGPDNMEGGSGYIPEADLEMQRLIESHKIGSAIAEEALRRSSAEYSPDVPSDVLHDAIFNPQTALVENVLGPDLSGYSSEVRNNVPLSSAGAAETSPTLEMNNLLTISPPSTSPPLATLGGDGNGEAAMAVIMSLLEADAGLGGPVNFSGLPWPLP